MTREGVLKGIKSLIRTAGIVLIIAAVVDQMRRPADERTWTGNVLIFPYDFRMPTRERFLERFWNPNDERIFTPEVFGVGWSVNLYQVVTRFRSMN